MNGRIDRAHRRARQGLLLCLLLGVSTPLLAEIYKYRGPNGGIHFTDHPMAGRYQLLWRSGREARQSYSTAQFRRNKSLVSPLIDATAKKLRLHPGLLHAIVMVESAYDPRARSKRGAQGLMQLMPETARRYDVEDAYNPRQNLEGGARYLRDLLREFDFDMRLALAAYNAGESAVRKYGNQIPPYPETQSYVRKVLDYYEKNMRLVMNDQPTIRKPHRGR